MSNITPTPSQSSSIPSVYRLVADTKCQTSQSPNAAANQLDIFLFVATSALDANISALSV